jgi:gliding motility-associated-like protein
VPGRDAQAWTVSTPDAYRFTPQTSGVSITGISWSPGISLSDTSIFNPVAAPAQNTCYTAEVTYNNGCNVRDTVCVSLSTFSYSIDVNPDTVCPGSQAQLFMSGQGVDFAWTPASLLNDSTLPNPIATVSNTTKFGVVAKNAAGCLIKDSAVVFVYTPPLVSLGSDFDVCACDTSINLNPVITDFTGNTQYLWSNSTTNSDLSVSNSGIYALTITDGNDCTASSSQQVNIYCLKVKASTSADKNTINKGDSTQLFSNISGSNYTPSLTYNWIPTASITDSILASPNASPLETTLYTVYVFDAINGCTALDSFSLTVNPPGLFAVPTGFSPNADGSNEYFYPYFPPGSSASVISMRIYNRWGQLVYSGAVAPGWDGKVGGLIAAIDTYTYSIQISSPDANQPNGAIVNNLVGSFALLR